MSTPFNVAQHLSQMLVDRSALALVDGQIWDMHRWPAHFFPGLLFIVAEPVLSVWLLAFEIFPAQRFFVISCLKQKSPAPQHCLVTMQKIMQSHFSWFIGDSSHWHCFCFILLTFTYSTADHVMRFYEYCYSYTGNYLDHWRMTARWSCFTFIPRILSTSTGKNQNQTLSHPLSKIYR